MGQTCRLLLGDCLQLLPTLEPGSIDCVIADPPYGDTSLAWDVPVSSWLPLVLPLLKPHGSLWCFGSMRFFLATAQEFAGWLLAQDVIWEKHNGSSFAADRFKRVHEQVLHFYPATAQWADIYKSPVYNYDAAKRSVTRRKGPPHTGEINVGVYHSTEGGKRLARSVIYAPSCHGYAIHPTQKPVDVLLPLIEYSCPPGGVVLDPFAGSASVGVAAAQLGRNYIGIERDEAYHAAALGRLASTPPPLAMPHGPARLFEEAAI